MVGLHSFEKRITEKYCCVRKSFRISIRFMCANFSWFVHFFIADRQIGVWYNSITTACVTLNRPACNEWRQKDADAENGSELGN